MANTCQTCHLYKASHQCLTCKMVFCLKCKLEFHLNYKNHEIEETKTEKDVLKLITGSFRSLYNKKHFSDIILNCQGVKFYAHKIVLSIFSDTLNKMFSSGLEETTKDEIKLICNTEPKVFELLLRYVYLQENLEIDWENAISLLTAANFYSIQGLVELCSISLQSLINEDNVCYLVITAQMNNTIDLKLKCLEFLIRNFEKAPIMDGFLKLDLSTMKDVIAYSASVNEQILFDSVYFWYKENLELSNIGTIFDHLDVKKIDMRSKTKIIDLVSDKPQSIPRRSIFFEVTLSEGDDFNYTIFPMLFTWKIPAMYLNLPKNESYGMSLLQSQHFRVPKVLDERIAMVYGYLPEWTE
jgi:hypothetical protein